MNAIPVRGGVEAPRDNDRGGSPSLHPAPVVPSEIWLEAARVAYLRRWWAENGDDFEFCKEAYGDLT